jgi:type I restriction enzyme S subunit
MKAGWDLRTLQQVSTIVNGGTPDTNVPDYWDGDILWITPKDMGKLRGRFVDDTFRKLTLVGLKNSSAKILPPNSLILSSRAPIGHLAINSKPISTNQGCKGLIPSDHLDAFYLYYFLLNSVEYLNSLGTGATFKELSGSKLGQVEIPLPPLPEQQRIVAILDEAFAAIDKAKANAEKNLKNAKELFESYLQGVFENKRERLKEVKISEIGLCQTGSTPKTTDKENFGNFIPFIKPADVNFTGVGDIRYTNDGLSEIGLKKARNMKKGSILMVCIGATIGKVGFTEIEVSCNQQINSLTPKEEYESKYIYYAMSSKSFQKKIVSEGKGAQATLPIINKSKWENLSISIHLDKNEQRKYSIALDALSTEAKHLESIYHQKLANLEELKKSILQKAFNGELNT